MASMVTISGLIKAFGNHVVLDGIDLDVNTGEKVSLIGPSGSGKTTLLRCINYLEEPNGGEILIDGAPIGRIPVPGGRPRRMSDRELARMRSGIGMVFQRFNLFPHMTVTENVMVGQTKVLRRSREDARHVAMALLDKVGMAFKADAYPDRLSGGQQQRVAIARALAMNPKIMLFDEATSALDPELVGEVLQVIRRLAAEGMTMIIVTHEMAFAESVSDRVVFMADGRIVEQGTPKQVFHNATQDRTRNFLRAVREH